MSTSREETGRMDWESPHDEEDGSILPSRMGCTSPPSLWSISLVCSLLSFFIYLSPTLSCTPSLSLAMSSAPSSSVSGGAPPVSDVHGNKPKLSSERYVRDEVRASLINNAQHHRHWKCDDCGEQSTLRVCPRCEAICSCTRCNRVRCMCMN